MTSQGDLLEAIFLAQHALQVNSYKKDPTQLEGQERIDFAHWNITALTDELHEALGEIGWKPWATSKHWNEEEFKNELVDGLHFFVNLCLAAGMGPVELARRYFEKREINARRQEEGYDGVSTKCPECKRAYDDPAVRCFPETATTHAWCHASRKYLLAVVTGE